VQRISPADEATLRRLVDPATYVRGRAYASRGTVTQRQWDDDGTRVLGEIQGGADLPYQASVVLTRSASEQLTAVEATCSCPVTTSCKHAVALLLAEGISSPQPSLPSPPIPSPQPPHLRLVPQVKAIGGMASPRGWELSLRGLLAPGGEDTVDEPTIGLQFEQVANQAKSPAWAASRIRIRPVLAGRAGNWVKTGISWSTLDYAFFGRAAPGAGEQQILLLKELLGLTRTTVRSYSYHVEDWLWLETISSRRLWDLLAEARTLGIPLVQAGSRPARPVTLHAKPATISVDITRARSGLRVDPQVRIGDDVVPLRSSLLVGRPAHGIVWWHDTPDSSTTAPPLSMASLASPMAEDLRPLLRGRTISVPARDQKRFVGEVLPALRRRLDVRSSDESVELPEIAPPTLLLTLQHLGDHRIELAWGWRRRVGAAEWIDDLWHGAGADGASAAEADITERALRVVRAVPELTELTPFGDRLTPRAELAGMPAVRFLTEVLGVIHQVGGVEIEQLGDVPDYREASAAPAVVLGGSGSASEDWFDLTVSISVDGEEVPFAELFVALAEERSHLILPSGTYFSLDREELHQLAKLIAEARGLDDVVSGVARLSRFQASLWEELRRLGIVTGQAVEWEQSVRALTNATERTEHPLPEGLAATLRPYQHAGFNWLAFLHEHDLGGILADDMGLGKTVQALALMCHVKERNATDAPFLVVAPTSVVENWALECRKFAPHLRVVTIAEMVGRRGVKLAKLAEDADVVITSYSLFRLEYGDYAAVEWAAMFLDEAQFAKNRNSQTYQRARMLPVRCKVAMTGTPMENNLMELWSLLSITAPGLFASPERFSKYYRAPIEKQNDTDRLDQLRRRMRPLMLRRTKEQVARDLPDKQEQVLELELEARHRKVYQTHLQRERQKVLGLIGDLSKNRFEIFRSLTLLRQVSLDPSLIDAKYSNVPSTKLDALMGMVGDIVADGHRVLIFSQFTRFLTSASDRLKLAGVEHCYLDGKTRKRAAVISRFRTGDAPAFLISLKAGGFGLNLTEADYCILLDPWWNPATEAQAVDRVHRIGQTKKVMVYRMVAKDTIEEKVMALKARKAALFANVIDAGGFESGALTAEDIRSLLS